MTTEREHALALSYQQARPRLTRIAYATIGSYTEAEDVVSDCWLRLVASDRHARVNDVDAWATVVVARAALDVVRSARRRRETYQGPWLPEPIVTQGSDNDPEESVTLDEHVSYALLVMLESLSPAERTSWVLHDLFGVAFSEIATTVGRTPAAVRQLAARARAHVKARAPRVDVSPEQHDKTVRQFRNAVAGGSLDELLRVLDPSVVLTSDGGGKVRAALRPVVGAAKVSRFVRGTLGQLSEPAAVRYIGVNGQTGLGVYESGHLTCAITLTLHGGRVVRIDMIRSPDKLPAPARNRTAAASINNDGPGHRS